MSDTVTLDDLLTALPRGEIQYARNHAHGDWEVSICEPGTTKVLATVATQMDKSVACWLMWKLREVDRLKP